MATKHETVFIKGNEKYASSFNSGSLALPPAKKLVVVTCMDARIDPLPALGLGLGDAHVIRNAGGRTVEAVRSIVVSQRLLGTHEIAVIHHTGCGMLTFTSDPVKSQITPTLIPQGSVVLESLSLLPFSDLDQSVKDDVEFLRNHELDIKESLTKITGWVYEVETGKIRRVQV